MTIGLERYRKPPVKVFRQMGLGFESLGYANVIAGFRVKWWCPFGSVVPIIVKARILRWKRTAV